MQSKATIAGADDVSLWKICLKKNINRSHYKYNRDSRRAQCRIREDMRDPFEIACKDYFIKYLLIINYFIINNLLFDKYNYFNYY